MHTPTDNTARLVHLVAVLALVTALSPLQLVAAVLLVCGPPALEAWRQGP